MTATERYRELMAVVEARTTTRDLDTALSVPREHYELILEAARHSPSPGNSQPWHFVVVSDADTKRRVADVYLAERARRLGLGMHVPDAGYAGIATAPGVIAVLADLRLVRAFPVPPDEAEAEYRRHQECMVLEAVGAAQMAAHLAAAALGYNPWWVTATGLPRVLAPLEELLGVPQGLALVDLLCFGPPAHDVHKRWKKELDEIISWERVDRTKLLSDDEAANWIRNTPANAFVSAVPPGRPRA
jgi:nitroreductase